ncbi:MBL fold metallo-hydrolase [Rhizobium binae]|uniref:MBL fold metallo-hydrolase n=1 Tax=Rhizobium binae TaxID=1138190 RepID=UPI0014425CE6|nr:MBL fold metallo-hydrolase [Rhizobium binae]NKL48563.1 MBL fold metallo-hydrolase [Rhizobium leguminosarum bv. viciae]MBX4938468.1 MBL fold metallo-hydrolase [Rhizobium binae]MBX4944975.1 MBL fold metallo-hydrolase [Rhizobium binae]MBX4961518.1 MBL fold metallo-hydrolase [Rhizobium binae]MBX4980278.1 MBL fold metallo-hydrolase [Rhizobium binae]
MDSAILKFHGAAGSVTGSCFLLNAGGAEILIDCGMFQGSKTEKELNYRPFPFDPGKIDAVLLTHAHIDHSGLLPKLAKDGFSGPIYTTSASVDLCAIMLQDSGHIQESEVLQLNRRNRRRSREAVEPIYTADEARSIMPQFVAVPYGEWRETAGKLKFRFWDAGHLLGSASIEIEAKDADGPVRLLFSGDVGSRHKLFESNPEAPSGVDYLICETTYGDREREDYALKERRISLQKLVAQSNQSNGVLLIPSFAVERTQEVLTDLIALMDTGMLPRCPVIIDSPLASKATDTFKKHVGSMEHGADFLRALNAPNVRFTETAEQSKALDLLKGFHIVIAASGMCEAGRIRHRLKNWLWRPECTVLFVGFQAAGTLGRILQDGAEVVRIQGEEIRVGARIATLDAYSGHADASELDDWVMERGPIRKAIFLVHGEAGARSAMSNRLAKLLPVEIFTPRLDDAYELKGESARLLTSDIPARLQPQEIGHQDWHNDYQNFVLNLADRLKDAADRKSRAVILRRLERALEDETNQSEDWRP